jgi:hypothetical protein
MLQWTVAIVPSIIFGLLADNLAWRVRRPGMSADDYVKAQSGWAWTAFIVVLIAASPLSPWEQSRPNNATDEYEAAEMVLDGVMHSDPELVERATASPEDAQRVTRQVKAAFDTLADSAVKVEVAGREDGIAATYSDGTHGVRILLSTARAGDRWVVDRASGEEVGDLPLP